MYFEYNPKLVSLHKRIDKQIMKNKLHFLYLDLHMYFEYNPKMELEEDKNQLNKLQA